ncbi:MAG: S8 family serine peptidase [SAR324 cluster bacterium]|nr:S8 family serine peptidase [SAR324 cluster bacterium]
MQKTKRMLFMLAVLIIVSGCGLEVPEDLALKNKEMKGGCGMLDMIEYKYSSIKPQPSEDIMNKTYIDYSNKNSIDDPLAYYQWHLSNRGQIYLNNVEVLRYNDINVDSVHNIKLIRGKGVKINVVDSGVEMKHEDLRVDRLNSFNFLTNDNKLTPPLFVKRVPVCVDHGTKVAGVIAAKSGNKVGIVGVAPAAEVMAYNLLKKYNIENFETAHGVPPLFGHKGSTNADIFNMSYGFYSGDEWGSSDSAHREVLKEGVKIGRNGLGYIYVKSAGNGFFDDKKEEDENKQENDEYTVDKCLSARALSLTCQNSNYDNKFIDPYHIKVSASDAYGKLSVYSTVGSSIFVNAPGGGYSVDIQSRTIANEDPKEIKEAAGSPAILTTDLMGCHRGNSLYSNLFSINDFEYNFLANFSIPNDLNNECNYTSSFNGTSAAAPIVSGVVALMLERNPNLTWRQVKYILAHTSTKIDDTYQGVYITYNREGVMKKSEFGKPGAYQIEQGWITNHAGLDFSNFYGFGRVDARKAVDMADSGVISSLCPAAPLKEHGSEVASNGLFLGNSMQLNPTLLNVQYGDYSVPRLIDLPATDYNDDVIPLSNVATYDYEPIKNSYSEGIITKIEAVTVIVNISAYDIGHIIIRLTSPSKTKSIILNPFTSIIGGSYIFNGGFLSNAFFGEDPAGRWFLEVFDVSAQDNSTINSAGIVIYGS